MIAEIEQGEELIYNYGGNDLPWRNQSDDADKGSEAGVEMPKLL